MKKGSKMTEEQRRKNRETQKKVWADPELRKRHSIIHEGQVPCNKGISPSKETIEKQKETYQRTLLTHPEIREKMSLAHRGKKRSEEAIRKFRLKMKGHKVSDETRRKISEAQKGKIIPEETRRKISEATKNGMREAKRLGKQIGRGKGIIPWHKGRKGVYSKEVLEKMSKSHKQQMSNPETRKKISLSIKKTYASNPEILQKMAETQRIRLSNPEARQLLREHTLKMYQSGAFPKQTNTLPERQIKAELIRRGHKECVDFVHQYKFMNKFMCDFCFPKQKVIIEVYGDFWHANPEIYSEGVKLHPHQIKGKRIDKSKEAYISKVDNHSWTYLVLWENDIKKEVTKCVDRIEEVLTRKMN